ncbi:MAG: hypothetical protein L0312_24315 [Acidobacteria bacterium]|nr:hypothetical protein [Acidobacteriota bacterium]
MTQKRRKRRAILINFSENEELDKKVWEKLLEDKASGERMPISTLVKKLLYDWYVYRAMGTAIWERSDNALNELGPHMQVPRARAPGESTVIDFSSGLAQEYASMIDLD